MRNSRKKLELNLEQFSKATKLLIKLSGIYGIKKVINYLSLFEHKESSPIIDIIEYFVCEQYNVTRKEIHNKTRNSTVQIAKEICIYLVRKHAENIPMEKIAVYFGINQRQNIYKIVKSYSKIYENRAKSELSESIAKVIDACGEKIENSKISKQ